MIEGLSTQLTKEKFPSCIFKSLPAFSGVDKGETVTVSFHFVAKK